jgi:hypothetical protein
MPSTINASASSGLITTADTSTILQLQTGGTTAVTVDASQNVTLAGTLTATGVTTVPAGTVSAPAITTTGDTNTGIYFPAADTIAFSEGGVESMRIDSSGNVGIGTSSPAQKLHVAGVGQFVSTNTMYVNPNYDTGVAAIQVSNNAGLVFATNNIERARIDSSGNLLVGKTAANLAVVGVEAKPNGYAVFTMASSTNSLDTLNVYSSTAANYRFYVGLAGTVFATNTTITAISDQRLKENIRDLDEGLATVMALKPRKFDWKEGKGADIKNVRGFIAQEFEQVLPDMIDIWKDSAPEGEEPYKAVNANLIPTLVKAIQEQQALITQLQADVAALKGAST